MAKFVFGMNLSLDGYVDHQQFAPDAVLFRDWIGQVRGAAGGIYGRRIYEIVRYWDEDQPDWTRTYAIPAGDHRNAGPLVQRLLDDAQLLGRAPATTTAAVGDDLDLRHKHVLRRMPKPP